MSVVLLGIEVCILIITIIIWFRVSRKFAKLLVIFVFLLFGAYFEGYFIKTRNVREPRYISGAPLLFLVPISVHLLFALFMKTNIYWTKNVFAPVYAVILALFSTGVTSYRFWQNKQRIKPLDRRRSERKDPHHTDEEGTPGFRTTMQKLQTQTPTPMSSILDVDISKIAVDLTSDEKYAEVVEMKKEIFDGLTTLRGFLDFVKKKSYHPGEFRTVKMEIRNTDNDRVTEPIINRKGNNNDKTLFTLRRKTGYLNQTKWENDDGETMIIPYIWLHILEIDEDVDYKSESESSFSPSPLSLLSPAVSGILYENNVDVEVQVTILMDEQNLEHTVNVYEYNGSNSIELFDKTFISKFDSDRVEFDGMILKVFSIEHRSFENEKVDTNTPLTLLLTDLDSPIVLNYIIKPEFVLP